MAERVLPNVEQQHTPLVIPKCEINNAIYDISKKKKIPGADGNNK